MPHLDVIRPADANETAEAWRVAVDRTHNPVAMVLTRQTVPIIDRSKYASAAGARKGGYVLGGSDDPELILIGTGSEVQLAIAAHETLSAEGVRSRVVSLPCWELFERQDQAYRDEVLPPAVTARVAVEEASTLGWERYVGTAGTIVGMHTFGQSAPFKDVEAEFGFSPEKVVEAARETLARAKTD
jgi:transketolase